ncbi:DUF6685 family protein [Pectobacterium carotovorum]|uniref:DUF6685 family protein n=1 Tax=Pectobacterium carotovorum TaxID=554 RepID=UPI0032EFB94D
MMSDDGFRTDRLDKRPLLHRVAGALWEEFRHFTGYPEGLSRAIRSGLFCPIPLQHSPDTFWLRSVVSWHTWMSTSRYGIPYALHYLQPDCDRQFVSSDVVVPEVANLVQEEVIEGFSCDITDIKGIGASKSSEYDINDIDEFPMQRCPSFVEPVTEAHLLENMRWGEIRLDRLYFDDYAWATRRLYWCNSGGSHHFGAARYQAVRLNSGVKLTGKLWRYSINAPMVLQLQQHWRLFLIPEREVFGHFYHAMKAFSCPFGYSGLPYNLHSPSHAEDALSIVWLARDNRKATVVADMLETAGFPDFGRCLDELVQATRTNSSASGFGS